MSLAEAFQQVDPEARAIKSYFVPDGHDYNEESFLEGAGREYWMDIHSLINGLFPCEGGEPIGDLWDGTLPDRKTPPREYLEQVRHDYLRFKWYYVHKKQYEAGVKSGNWIEVYIGPPESAANSYVASDDGLPGTEVKKEKLPLLPDGRGVNIEEWNNDVGEKTGGV